MWEVVLPPRRRLASGKVSLLTSGDGFLLLLFVEFEEDAVRVRGHRRVDSSVGAGPVGDRRLAIGSARVLRSGGDATVVAMSLMSVEALHAVDHLARQGVNCDLIDLRTVRPIDWPTIEASVRRTGRLLVLDTGYQTGGVAGEIVARVAGSSWKHLRTAPQRLAMPDVPEATSQALRPSTTTRAPSTSPRLTDRRTAGGVGVARLRPAASA